MNLSSEIITYINRSVLCWLATAAEDGQPNVSPKEVFDAYGEEQILVANIASPQTMRNIRINEKVCISFIDVLVQKGYQIKGAARILTAEDREFEPMKEVLIKIAGKDFPFSEIIEITVKSAKQILAPRYILFPGTREEEQIRSAKRIYGVEQ